jgi:hypothetical protein
MRARFANAPAMEWEEGGRRIERPQFRFILRSFSIARS